MGSVETYFIVGYAGGTCGDLITAIINPDGCSIDGTKVSVPDHRQKLKKAGRFADDMAKDAYIEEFKNLRSLSSHDIEYHIRKIHPFLGITVENYELAHWAAGRFKALHSDRIWAQMQYGSIEDYANSLINLSKGLIVPHAKNTLSLEDIVNGHAIERLQEFVTFPNQSIEFYKTWLEANQF